MLTLAFAFVSYTKQLARRKICFSFGVQRVPLVLLSTAKARNTAVKPQRLNLEHRWVILNIGGLFGVVGMSGGCFLGV